MPVVASGLASARIRKVFAMKNIPTPVTAQAMMTAVTEACWAMFCGRLKMPPPIIAETTSAASAVTPSFLLSSAMMLIPPLVVSSKLPGAPGASGGGGGVLRRIPDAFAHDDQFGAAD